MALVSVPRIPHLPKTTPSKKETDVGSNSYLFYKVCGKYHYKGNDKCFKLYLELFYIKPKKIVEKIVRLINL